MSLRPMPSPQPPRVCIPSSFRYKISYYVPACASSRYWWWASRKLCSNSSCERGLRCRSFRGNEISKVCLSVRHLLLVLRSWKYYFGWNSVALDDFITGGYDSLMVVTHTFVFFLVDRYHVGESLIPSIRHYMRFIDAEEKVANHGFVRKVRHHP